ncbi:uncharacterized protein LOC120640351 [Panicum virgatum]|uniref:uncharacterized protein LOC120640351 n=1 Tax=Panicum virgatum TaxID=38727 RepID=UPI0019D64180|nr:uncharacterized protein LOC120640351 [Panicum virgatum]
MDGGSSLNILYAHTLELMGIVLDKLHPSVWPFHGVMPGKRVQPLGQIDLPVCFGTPSNSCKEVLTFEGVITVGPSFDQAYECDVECVEHAEAQVDDEALAATLDKMASEALDSTCRHAGSFEPAKGIKKVPLDPCHPDGKALRVSDTLDSK